MSTQFFDAKLSKTLPVFVIEISLMKLPEEFLELLLVELKIDSLVVHWIFGSKVVGETSVSIIEAFHFMGEMQQVSRARLTTTRISVRDLVSGMTLRDSVSGVTQRDSLSGVTQRNSVSGSVLRLLRVDPATSNGNHTKKSVRKGKNKKEQKKVPIKCLRGF